MKITDLDSLLKLVQAPKQRLLLGYFCRTIEFTINKENHILDIPFDTKKLKNEVSQHTGLEQDITSKYYGTHELKGQLDQLYLYAIFTAKNRPENEPNSFSLIRAMLLVILTHPAHKLSLSNIKTISSILRNYTEKTKLVEKSLQETPSDPESWKKYFSKNNSLPDSWIKAILSLAGAYQAANRYHLIQKKFTKPVKPKATEPFTLSIIELGKKTAGGLLGTDFSAEPTNLVAPDGLAPADKVDPAILLVTPAINADETPLLHTTEETKTLINHQNWFFGNFVQFSNTVLLDSEIEVVFRMLRTELKKAHQAHDLDSIEQIIALYFTAVTSWSLRTIYCLSLLDSIPSNEIESNTLIEGLSIQKGILLFQIPDVSRFWKPNTENTLFKGVGGRIQLSLPVVIVSALNVMCSLQLKQTSQTNALFTQNLEDLQKGILEKRKILRQHPELRRFSLERLRNFLPTRLYTNTHDSAIVMLITGQSHGLSTAPLHYYQTEEIDLQTAYESALLPLLEDNGLKKFVHSIRYDLPPIIGSKLQLPDHEIQSFIEKLIKPLKTRPKELQAQLTQFNHLTVYLSFMIMATTGHRNTRALGNLVANDFDLKFNMALISDKVSDPGHRARLVAIPVILCQQIDIYKKLCIHLSKLLSSKGAKKSLRKSNALQRNQLATTLHRAGLGKDDLLWTITPEFDIVPINNNTLKAIIPTHWNCPLNFFRHRLATQLRKQNTFPEYIHHQLGHIESGNQPFGQKSTLKPVDFITHMQSHLDQLAVKDGWLLVKVNIAIQNIETKINLPISFKYRESQQYLHDEELNYWKNTSKARVARKLNAKKDI